MEKKDYKNVFVFAEQREGVIQSVALELLGKARDLADALGEKVVAMLLGEGIKDQAQMLIEFGAGIHYNHVENPKASEFGMGVGTYPGQTHAFQEEGWYYMDESGEWHHTYGVKATMPMYNADIEILMNINRVAREIFSK